MKKVTHALLDGDTLHVFTEDTEPSPAAIRDADAYLDNPLDYYEKENQPPVVNLSEGTVRLEGEGTPHFDGSYEDDPQGEMEKDIAHYKKLFGKVKHTILHTKEGDIPLRLQSYYAEESDDDDAWSALYSVTVKLP